MGAWNKKYLLVEGQEDKYAVAQLMGQFITPWEKPNVPVEIKPVGSADEILEPDYISTELQSPEVKILGIVIDANGQFNSRWSSIRRECISAFPATPENFPETGLVVENADAKRLGVWIMPNNSSCGMLETFLSFLIPGDQLSMWGKAQSAVSEARAAGAPCRESHVDKANIHTWLAWQDPPGQALGNAILQNILDAKSPHATKFVEWFKRLYQF